MLGGDLYDIVRRDDSGVVLVADVMGHGFEAALIAMLVKAAFQEAAAINSDPGMVLGDMRRRLRRTVPAGRSFVAAAIIRLDPDGAGLQLVNAGLPHPFVLGVRHDGSRRFTSTADPSGSPTRSAMTARSMH